MRPAHPSHAHPVGVDGSGDRIGQVADKGQKEKAHSDIATRSNTIVLKPAPTAGNPAFGPSAVTVPTWVVPVFSVAGILIGWIGAAIKYARSDGEKRGKQDVRFDSAIEDVGELKNDVRTLLEDYWSRRPQNGTEKSSKKD